MLDRVCYEPEFQYTRDALEEGIETLVETSASFDLDTILEPRPVPACIPALPVLHQHGLLVHSQAIRRLLVSLRSVQWDSRRMQTVLQLRDPALPAGWSTAHPRGVRRRPWPWRARGSVSRTSRR
jgi:hypothetical protein